MVVRQHLRHALLPVVRSSFAADIVLHSTTKYLNATATVGGLLVTRRDDLAERIGSSRTPPGGPRAMDCWLALRESNAPTPDGQHDTNGRASAEWLGSRSDLAKLYYRDSLASPARAGCRQMTGFGGMISLDPRHAGRARRFVEATRIFALAESLGGVESLIGHPPA